MSPAHVQRGKEPRPVIQGVCGIVSGFPHCYPVRDLPMRSEEMGIFLLALLLVGLGFPTAICSSSSSPERVNPTCNGFGLYVMESYFEKHGSLLDPTFQEFIADKLQSGSCQLPQDQQNSPPRVSILRRQLIGEGAHRHLSSTIKLNFLPEPSSQSPSCSSKVIVIERLPSGVFADPFELQHLLESGAFAAVSVMGDTNLELPAFLSNRSLVEIHIDIDFKLLSEQSNDQEISINLPIHARYPPLDENGYHEVRFGEPDLLVYHTPEGGSGPRRCLLMPNIDGSGLNNSDVFWKIPSGRRAHANVVSVVTFVAAFASAVAIVWSSIFHSSVPLFKHKKQS